MPIILILLGDLFYKTNTFKGIAIIDLFKSIINYPLAFLLILFIFLCIYLIIISLYNNKRKANITLLIIALIFLLINDLKYIIMLNPVALSDVHFLNTSNIGTAGLYLKTVQGTWVFKTLFKFILGILLIVLYIKKTKNNTYTKYSFKSRLCLFLIPLTILFIFFKISINHPIGMVKHIYNYDYEDVLSTTDYGKVYYEEGLFQGIIYNLYASKVHKPVDYKKEYAINALSSVNSYNEENWGKPNVVLILSESFSDITNLNDISFKNDVLYNIHELDKKDNAIVTNLHVSTFGGSSVISEWEALTSSSNNFNPVGYIAYTSYYNKKNKDLIDNSPNIVRLFNNEGYITKYITPWASESYNSGIVYDLLGMKDIKYDLKGKKRGFYLSDQEITDSIMKELNKDKDKPKFLIYATAENHMPCSKDKFKNYNTHVKSSKFDKENTDLLKCYAEGVSDADKALGDLYNEIMNFDQNTIVIFYGDHLPFITNDNGDNAYLLSKYFNTNDDDLNDLRKYTTKGVIFSNYLNNLDKSIKYINLNYLTAYVFSKLDIKNNEYYKYVDNIRNYIPVFSKTYLYDPLNDKITKLKSSDEELYNKLKEYRMVQYYSFYDNK